MVKWIWLVVLFGVALLCVPAQQPACSGCPCSITGLAVGPQIYAQTVGTQPPGMPPVSIRLVCNNLTLIPALSGLDCSRFSVSVPATVPPGTQIYMGMNQSGILHVSDGNASPEAPQYCPQSSTVCFQDIFSGPAPGEYVIGTYTVASRIAYGWTGVPTIPLVNVMGCDTNGYTVAYTAASITVTCQ